MKFWILRDDEQLGPYSIDDSKRMVQATDLIWMEGKSNAWTRATDVPEFRDFLPVDYAQVNQTVEASSYTINDRYSRTSSRDQAVHGEKRHRSGVATFPLAALFFCIVILASAVLITRFIKASGEGLVKADNASALYPTPKEPLDNTSNFQNALSKEVVLVPDSTTATPKKIKPANLRKLVKLTNNDYKKGLLGGINDLKLTVENNSEQLLDKVTVQLDYLKRNGQVLTTDTLYVNMVKPKSSKTIDVPKSSRGVKVQHKILNIKSYENKTAMLNI
ncbi:MAG TPA: DUF4339 domain-containing protein [Chitinophagaceae bacterium]|nr:DUF4339 domain-containing protein [Chitinophagaceae bacterium]